MITCKKLKAMIKDEAMAIKEYQHVGLNNLAIDEHKHKMFLEKLKKQGCNK